MNHLSSPCWKRSIFSVSAEAAWRQCHSNDRQNDKLIIPETPQRSEVQEDLGSPMHMELRRSSHYASGLALQMEDTMQNQARAIWSGGQQSGVGMFEIPADGIQGKYSSASNPRKTEGTNPVALIAAAQASSFSSVLAHFLEQGRFEPKLIETEVTIFLERTRTGYEIYEVLIITKGMVPGISASHFAEIAQSALLNCPVSELLDANLCLNAWLCDGESPQEYQVAV